MGDMGKGVSITPEIVYHWTPAHNQNSIIEDSLLVPGESSSSGTKVSVVNGEALGKGIYTSTNPQFGAHFGQGARGAFLCLGLPGRQVNLSETRRPKAGSYDSVRNDTVRVYTASDFLLPCFITEVKAAAPLCSILEEVKDLLVSKV